MKEFIVPVYNQEGKEVEKITLDKSVFDGTVHMAAMHQAVVVWQANQRKGLAAAKTRGQVSGGGKKPWRQKGTGRARVGSIRSPLWRHGGVIFGPQPRDYSLGIPKKVKRLALRSALNLKLKTNNIRVIDNISLSGGKTKEMISVLNNLSLITKKNACSILFLSDKIDDLLRRACRNIEFLTLGDISYANTYTVLWHRNLLVTKGALEKLTEQLKC